MIDYIDYDLFTKDNIPKQLKISFSEGDIFNENIREEEFSLEEVLNSGKEITFGECNAAKVSFVVGYYEKTIADEELTISITPEDGDLFQFGIYKVLSDYPTADRKWREIIAYDKLYEILKADMTSWFNSILPNSSSTVTLKQFRDSFFSSLGVLQETVVLPNDNMIVKRKIDPKVITGKTILTKICEINGCFGKIGRDGNFHYVFLQIPDAGLFPADDLFPGDDVFPEHFGMNQEYPELSGIYPGDDIFPGDDVFPERAGEMGDNTYISLKYEDYLTQNIDKLRFLDEQGNVTVEVGNGENVYIVKDNFLLFGQETSDLSTIANNMYSQISGIWYRPCEMHVVGNPCIETGDGLQLNTIDGKQIDTYVLHRKLKGIQSLKDVYIANGLEYRANNNNTIQEQIIQNKNGIRQVKADLIEAQTILAGEIQAERAKIDALTAIAITTENLSAQTISASQITTGTLDASRITVNNLSASSINSGQMSVDRLTDIYGGSAQSRWYEITYASSGYITMHDYVSVRNGSNTGTEHVPTTAQLHLTTQRLYVLKGSPLNP